MTCIEEEEETEDGAFSSTKVCRHSSRFHENMVGDGNVTDGMWMDSATNTPPLPLSPIGELGEERADIRHWHRLRQKVFPRDHSPDVSFINNAGHQPLFELAQQNNNNNNNSASANHNPYSHLPLQVYILFKRIFVQFLTFKLYLRCIFYLCNFFYIKECLF